MSCIHQLLIKSIPLHRYAYSNVNHDRQHNKIENTPDNDVGHEDIIF